MKRKGIIYKGLQNIPVYVEDNTLTSPDYFQITEFPEQFTAGKNSFRFKGNPDVFVYGSDLQIEIIDFNGEPIYYEVVDYLTDDGSIIISVYVYEDTPSGACTVTMIGQSGDVPDEWQGIPNVRWSRESTVNAMTVNVTEIVFDELPVVNITEQVGVHLDRSYTNGQFPTYSTGTVQYTSYQEQPAVQLSGGKFTRDMVGGTITVSSPQNPTPTPDYTLSTTAYTTTIKKILSDSLALLDTEYQVLHSASMTIHTYKNFDASSYSISYEATPTYVATQNSESYAAIEIRGLQPATGDVARIKTFMNNNGTVGTWELINDIELVETEIFVTSTSSLTPDISIGSFTSQSIINTYWEAHTYIRKTETTTPTLTWSSASLNNAMSVSSNIDISASDAVYVAQIKSAYAATFVGGAEYKVTIDAIGTSNNALLPKLSVYLSGSAFDFDSTDLFNQQLPVTLGRRIGEIELTSNNQRLDDYVFNFEADKDGTATLLLVMENGTWQFSDVRTTTDNDSGYTPNYTRIRSLVPTAHKSGNQLSFKVEYYNVAGERSKQISYVYDKSWTGGNRYIDGDYSMITGSLYVADTLGSGIAITGQRNTGYVRSLGYTGFDEGNPGFLIWSGSALPGATSKGSAYSGVGIELYANTGSYLRYSTSDSELDIRTDKFFVGNSTQFISGSNGNIEILASGFHLDAAGNITASNGEFRGVNLADSYQYRVIEIQSSTDPHLSTYTYSGKTYMCLNLTGSYDPAFSNSTSPAMFIKFSNGFTTGSQPMYPIGAIKIHPDSWITSNRYQTYGGTVVIEAEYPITNLIYLASNAVNTSMPDSYIAGASDSYDNYYVAFQRGSAIINGTTYSGNIMPLDYNCRATLLQSANYWNVNTLSNHNQNTLQSFRQFSHILEVSEDLRVTEGGSKATIDVLYPYLIYLTSSRYNTLNIITTDPDAYPISIYSSGSTEVGKFSYSDGSTPGNLLISTKLNKSIELATDNTVRLTISGSGEVGIDALADGVKFNVQTNAISGQEKIARFRVSDDTNSYMSIQNATTANNVLVPMLVGQNSSTSSSLLLLGRAATDAGTAAITIFDSRIGDDTTNSAAATRPLFHWRNNGTVYMAMNATGSVGIGITTPSAKLHVNNTTALDSFLVEDSTNPDSSPFVIDNSGNVGVGTTAITTLSASLFAGTVPKMEIITGNVTTTYSESIVLRHVGISSAAETRSLGLLMKLSTESMPNESVKMGGMMLRSTQTFANSPALHFVLGDAERMTIASGGNVGIGTTSPSAQLHVVQDAAATSFRIDDEVSDTTPFIVDQAGFVGINKSTPTANLDVTGSVLITGSLQVSGSIITTGSFTINSGSAGPAENTLTLGPAPAGGTGEGGQLGLNAAGGTYTSASFLDNYQNTFRILRGPNGGSNTALITIDLQTGNLTGAGTITPNVWNAGDVIQMRAFKPGDSGVFTSGSAAQSTSNSCFFSCSFTPKSTTSYIIAEMSAYYAPVGGGNDSFISTLTVNGSSGTEMGYSKQVLSSTAGSDRSGVLFPLSGRYTNSSTSTITICANVRRDSSDDNINFDNGNASSMTMVITEIGR